MDIGLIIPIIATGIAIVGVVIAMMFWCRNEANSLRAEAKEDRKDLLQIGRSLELAVMAIQAEMKDFHKRLCEIESKRSGAN